MMKSLDTKKLKTEADEVEKTSPSAAAQIAASSSIDDLLIEIIQRLPLKQLVQLKLVSKHWNSVISDPKLCFLRNRRAAGLIFEDNNRHSYIISLDKSLTPSSCREMTPTKDPWYRHHRKILHSCNGLVVCAKNHLTRKKYYICNPTTKQYSTLPQLVHDEVSNTTTIRGMVLALDPSKSPHYKVVCVLGTLESSSSSSCLLHVYSSETGLWCKCGSEGFTANADLDFQDGVYWNGAIHWLNIVSEPRESIYFNPDNCDHQTPKVFPMPPILDGCHERGSYYFGESCDHLHFIGANVALAGLRLMSPLEGEFNVYEMKRDYTEWFVKYKVNVSGFSYLDFCYHISRFDLVRGKNDDEDSVLVDVNREIFKRYNLDKKTCETFNDGGCPVFLGKKRPFQYIQSLSSV